MAKTELTVYGDFNCPFSALASARADVLIAADTHAIDWRAIQHDTGIPALGEAVAGDLATSLAGEVATIRELSDGDLRLELAVPRDRSNTAAACEVFAGASTVAEADRLRRLFFSAVWQERRNISALDELAGLIEGGRDVTTAARWQREFDALPQPVTPTLVLPDGYVSRGLGALRRLADFVAATPSSREEA
jgi:predicted DsbA family dithiol-disulfide isomerase